MDLDSMPSLQPHLSGTFGSVGEYGEWKVVMQAFREDKLEAAYEAALQLGTGPNGALVRAYRQIEAEAATRKVAAIRHPLPWLWVETTSEHGETLDAFIETVIESTRKRFGYEHQPNLMVTILISEVNMPWAPGRFGYFIEKIPYSKICIPMHSTASQEEFAKVLAHEYTHLIALDLAGGLAPRWLNEAIAQVAEERPTDRFRHVFATGQAPWRAEHELEFAFAAESNDEAGSHVLEQAYAQAAIIGRYLYGLKGNTGLADLLKGFSNNSRWEDLKIRITGQEPAHEAVKEVYGITVPELFESAKPTS